LSGLTRSLGRSATLLGLRLVRRVPQDCLRADSIPLWRLRDHYGALRTTSAAGIPVRSRLTETPVVSLLCLSNAHRATRDVRWGDLNAPFSCFVGAAGSAPMRFCSHLRLSPALWLYAQDRSRESLQCSKQTWRLWRSFRRCLTLGVASHARSVYLWRLACVRDLVRCRNGRSNYVAHSGVLFTPSGRAALFAALWEGQAALQKPALFIVAAGEVPSTFHAHELL
jgi:hypothetical protein